MDRMIDCTPIALGYLGIESPRVADWVWYGPDVLGCELAMGLPSGDGDSGTDGVVRLRTDDRHHRLAVHPGPADATRYVGWEFQDPDSLSGAIARVARSGFDLHDADARTLADRCVRQMAWFIDGEGLRQELFYGQTSAPKTFRPGRPMRGFEAEATGLGHVAIGVSDIVSYRRFAIDVLGLSLTDEIDAHVPLLFFHASSRHHCLAIGGTPGRSGLFHLGLTLLDLDDVGTCYDRAIERDVPIRRSFGRHTNDRVVSFYLGTPSGFDIEVGWGAVQVEPGRHPATVFKTTSIWGHHQLTPSSFLPPLTAPAF